MPKGDVVMMKSGWKKCEDDGDGSTHGARMYQYLIPRNHQARDHSLSTLALRFHHQLEPSPFIPHSHIHQTLCAKGAV